MPIPFWVLRWKWREGTRKARCGAPYPILSAQYLGGIGIRPGWSGVRTSQPQLCSKLEANLGYMTSYHKLTNQPTLHTNYSPTKNNNIKGKYWNILTPLVSSLNRVECLLERNKNQVWSHMPASLSTQEAEQRMEVWGERGLDNEILSQKRMWWNDGS